MPTPHKKQSNLGTCRIQGIGATRGVEIGRAHIRQPHTLEISQKKVPANEVPAQLQRLHCAIEAARQEIHALQDRLRGALDWTAGEFLELHAMLIDDPELLQNLDALIQENCYSAEYAVKVQHQRLGTAFQKMQDPYLKSRIDDLDHVISRIFAFLQERPPEKKGRSGDILISQNVSPSELTELQSHGIRAIVTANGSSLSHTAILARSMHLPLVVAAGESIFQKIKEDDTLIIDGNNGLVLVNPSSKEIEHYRACLREQAKEQRALGRLRHKVTRTADHVDILLRANAESENDIKQSYAIGADGVGLYRTEFFFLARNTLPTEEEQFQAYRKALLEMRGRLVTIRTLDLGADKADRIGLAASNEANPALGIRGIRLLLKHSHVAKAHLRAIIRASEYGPLRILIPMIGGREDAIRAKQMIRRISAQLLQEGHAIAQTIPIGAMIEVPSAALTIDTFIDQLDFLSIGTNDLTQYVLAVDRTNEDVSDSYSPLHPAVLRLLHTVIQTANQAEKPVCLCGEMAGNPYYIPLLLALGLTDFSLHPGMLLEVRNTVRLHHYSYLRSHTARLLQARDRRSIQNWLKTYSCPPKL